MAIKGRCFNRDLNGFYFVGFGLFEMKIAVSFQWRSEWVLSEWVDVDGRSQFRFIFAKVSLRLGLSKVVSTVRG